MSEESLRIGYMVTAYKEQSQLERLLRTLLRWDSSGQIALHFDHSKATLDLGGLSHERLHVLSEWCPVTWGDSSYLTVLQQGLRWWSHRNVDWVIILSGQDYPIRPVTELREFLAKSGRNSFIWGGKLGVPSSHYRVDALDAVQQRYFAHWGKLPGLLWSSPTRPITQKLLRFGRRIPGGLVVRELPHNDRPWVGWRPPRKHPFTEDWPCCFGWDYFALDQEAISVLISEEDRVAGLRRWYQRSINPTESFFITVLRGHPRIRSGAKALHYVHWENLGDPHPAVLDEHEFGPMRDSGRFFARKFDSHSTPLLDRIDVELLGLDTETNDASELSRDSSVTSFRPAQTRPCL